MRKPKKNQKNSPEMRRAICAWIASGQTLSEFCRQTPGAPDRCVVSRWARQDPEFRERLNEARDAGYDEIADDILRIADTQVEAVRTEVSDQGTKTVTEDAVAHRKLQIYARLQLLAKWDPRRYGEKVALDHAGGVSITVATGVPK